MILKIQNLITHIDQYINHQLNQIIHHPKFQALESAWLGLQYLTQQIDKKNQKKAKIKLLNINEKTLANDLNQAIDFDQSYLFKKIYSNEFDQPGGEPFGILIGNYYINHRNTHPEQLSMLSSLAKIAAAAFAPFICSADAKLFGLNHLHELQPYLDLKALFKQQQYNRWHTLRKQPDTRFIGLVLPTILMRPPYQDSPRYFANSDFKEHIRRHQDYLWGNASFYYGAVVIQSFIQTGWFNNIRGDQAAHIQPPAKHHFKIDHPYFSNKNISDIRITDRQEKILSDLGFIPLCTHHQSPSANFYSSQSLQDCLHYDESNAATNAKISAMLQYIFCVSRFAHTIKIIARNKVGSFNSSEACENYLRHWLLQYCAANTDTNPHLKLKYPLRKANIRVIDNPTSPGSFQCIMHFQPHYQLDEIQTQLHLSSDIPATT